MRHKYALSKHILAFRTCHSVWYLASCIQTVAKVDGRVGSSRYLNVKPPPSEVFLGDGIISARDRHVKISLKMSRAMYPDGRICPAYYLKSLNIASLTNLLQEIRHGSRTSDHDGHAFKLGEAAADYARPPCNKPKKLSGLTCARPCQRMPGERHFWQIPAR